MQSFSYALHLPLGGDQPDAYILSFNNNSIIDHV